jgi:altronate dehydratase
VQEIQAAFKIQSIDSVATALIQLQLGIVMLRGDSVETSLEAIEIIPVGHKIATRDIADGEDIVKYGVVIGRADRAIAKGSWVHLHCMHSLYDERSSHLDLITGAPKDTKYE